LYAERAFSDRGVVARMRRKSLDKRALINSDYLKCLEPVAAFIKIFPLEDNRTGIRRCGIVGFPEIIDIGGDYPSSVRVTVGPVLNLAGRLLCVADKGEEQDETQIRKAPHISLPEKLRLRRAEQSYPRPLRGLLWCSPQFVLCKLHPLT